MKKERLLYIDQYGCKYYASTIKELKEKVGAGKISKMYIDGKDGKIYHTGYVIGKNWLSFYKPLLIEQ